MVRVEDLIHIRNLIFKNKGQFLNLTDQSIVNILSYLIEKDEKKETVVEKQKIPENYISISDFVKTTNLFANSSIAYLCSTNADVKTFSIKANGKWYFDPWKLIYYVKDSNFNTKKKAKQFLENKVLVDSLHNFMKGV